MNLLKSGFVAVSLAAFSLMAWAEDVVVNGSLTGPTTNMGVPDSWVTVNGTPDTLNGSDNAGITGLQRFGAMPDASPDGGTWVGLGSYDKTMESFGQTLKGLKMGQLYTVSWLVGNFGYSAGDVQYTKANAIDVQIDRVSIGTGQQKELGSDWKRESLTFMATSTDQFLSFQLASMDKSYLSIDGVKVEAFSGQVPEPTSVALMGLGLLGVAAAARRRKA